MAASLLTVYNGLELIARSSERRELRARIERDLADDGLGSRRDDRAPAHRRSRDTRARLAASTGEANDVIGQRTFSWTEFFGLIERTLPIDVRLVTVSPRVERGVFKVSMSVVARELADVSEFVDALLRDRTVLRRRDPSTCSVAKTAALNAKIDASYLSARDRQADGRPRTIPAGATR